MEGGGLHIPQTELVYSFRQDGRFGIINLHIIILFLVGICRGKSEREAWVGARRSAFQWSKVLFFLLPRTSFKRKGNCHVHLGRASVPLEASFKLQSLTSCKARADLVKLRKQKSKWRPSARF